MKQKRLILGLLVMLSMSAYAASSEPTDTVTCDSLARFYNAQPFFCECEFNSHPFAFPVDTVIADTTWFTATADDLKRGISAYWFADCSVTMEVYAMCVSQEPTFTLTIGRNQMREMDVTKINKKIEEMGNAAAYLKNLTPHIRVYPHNGGSGRVYCYPYDQGPHSVCDDPLEVRAGMTYVCNEAENKYRLPWQNMPASGKAFIAWKQLKNQPADFVLTLDSCNGEEIGRTRLTDSLHVYQFDSAQLVTARKEKREIWLHVNHAKGFTGRVYYYYINANKIVEGELVENSTCLGKKLTVNERTYVRDTSFVDTTRIAVDSLLTTPVHFTFTEPKMEYDTVSVMPADLNRGYRHSSGHVLNTYGDTIVEIVKPNVCTRRIQVTVLDPSGVESVSAGRNGAYKQLQNGQLFILIDDRKYNVLGQQTQNKPNN